MSGVVSEMDYTYPTRRKCASCGWEVLQGQPCRIGDTGHGRSTVLHEYCVDDIADYDKDMTHGELLEQRVRRYAERVRQLAED